MDNKNGKRKGSRIYGYFVYVIIAVLLGFLVYFIFNQANQRYKQISTSEAVQTFASNYKTSKNDKEADLVGVNLMVNAGYNPLAMIVVLTKQTGTYWDTIIGRPANAEKALNVYDYISYVYPEKLKVGYGCNEYRNFLAYANTITEERKENKKLAKNYDKTYKKAKKNTANSITKFKTRGGISGWDAVYGLLNSSQQ